MNNPENIRLKNIDTIQFDEISDQIAVRRYLQRQMVGNLYPSVLENEITALIKRQDQES